VTARKVHINGEMFEFDGDYRPLAEALALEKAYGASYGQWERDLNEGAAKAIAGLAWLVWRRDGRDVTFADLLSGEVELDLASIEREDAEPEPEPDPTAGAAEPAAPPAPGA
jgi:hypothetical protein